MQSNRQPNIILILLDDLGWTDLGCYGSSFYETPCIDKLSKDGVRFTNAYAASPVCSPTRASIMTGKYPANLGVTHYIGAEPEKGKLIGAPYVDHLPTSEISVANALKEGGYQTWHVGKWHMGGTQYYPDRHGFDVNIGGCSWGAPKQGYFSPYGLDTLADGPEGEYLTDRLTDEAIRLIKQNQVTKKPFFMYLSHYAVHIPIEAKQVDIDKYKTKAKQKGLDKVQPFKEDEFFPVEHLNGKRVKRRLVQSDATYAAMIENLDQNIARLLDSLETTQQVENTVVIFTSDNGGLATAEGSPTCNYPLNEGKGWMYEGGVREPLIVKWPGQIKPGSECSIPVTSPDFYPTLLEIAGLPLRPEQHEDGVSILSLLRGEMNFDRGPVFWHFPHYGNQGGTPGSSIREGDYKLIEFFETGELELYNLRQDLSEEHNLAKEMPDRVIDMHAKLVTWRNKMDAKIPLPNPQY